VCAYSLKKHYSDDFKFSVREHVKLQMRLSLISLKGVSCMSIIIPYQGRIWRHAGIQV